MKHDFLREWFGRVSGDKAAMEAHTYFPRGLAQPESGYRFSLDSLLLSCFSRISSGAEAVDLGTGCGVVAFGALLKNPEKRFQVTGVELSPESVEAATSNAEALGLSEFFTAVRADICTYRDREGRVDAVLANPPYRNPNSGRMSRGKHRAVARFEMQAEFRDFCTCATRLLKNRGRFFLVHLPERLVDLFADLRDTGLEPKRVRFVHSRAAESAKMVLVEARKDGKPGLETEPPLILYTGRGQETHMTPEALAFCPYLECNAGKASAKT